MDEKLFSARMAEDKKKVDDYLAACLNGALDARRRRARASCTSHRSF